MDGSGVQSGSETAESPRTTGGGPASEVPANRGEPADPTSGRRERLSGAFSGRPRHDDPPLTPARLRRFWNWFLRTRPFPYPRQVAGAAMALLYVVGGLTTLLVLALPHRSSLQVPIMLTLSAMSPLVGLAVYLLRHRLPSGAYPWLLATGTVIITIMIGATGGYSEMVSFSFFYMWIVLYAVLFFSPLGIAAQVGLVMAGYWAISAFYDDSGADKLTPLEPVVLVSIIATTGTVCALLAKAREASEVDPLTRVANRRGLDHALDLALEFAERMDPRLKVAMIDVDHFKNINDQNGHAVGDQVLQELTTSWRPLLRPDDSVGRRGGDEFLVVLPGYSTDEAAAVLERLRTAAPTGVTCSIGAAHWRAGDSASMLVSKADAALYEAKRRGRDRVVWALAE